MDVLRALGAEVLRTPSHVSSRSGDSHIGTRVLWRRGVGCQTHVGLAKRLTASTPHAVMFNQYENELNAQTHYDTTAEEILHDTNGGRHLDMVVIGAGTCGTIMGVGRKLRERAPHVTVRDAHPKRGIPSGCARVPHPS